MGSRKKLPITTINIWWIQIQSRLRFGMANSINTYLRLKIQPPSPNTMFLFKLSLIKITNLKFSQNIK